MSKISYHIDKEVGITHSGPKCEEISDGLGGRCWKATAAIGTIFGAEVEGECVGIGRTKEQALERLKKDQANLYESIWE